MRIIIEGVDGIGKSTLCLKLSKYFESAIVHNRADTDNSYEYYVSLHEVEHLIQDRSYISEVIYSEAFNRKIRLTNEELLALDIMYSDAATIVLYSSNGYKFAVNNNNETVELRSKQFKISELYKDYNKAMNNTDIISIDVAHLDADQVFKAVLDMLGME